MSAGRIKAGNFKTAWIEYQDGRDAAMHVHGLTTRLGFKNLLSDLSFDGNDKTVKVSRNLFNFTARIPDNSRVKAFVGQAFSQDEAFLGKWTFNPGVENGELTFNDVPNQADIVAFSGHGSSGWVFGNENDQGTLEIMRLSNELESASPQVHGTGKVKILIVATCTNVALGNAVRWAPVFNRPNPIHMILGYEDSYSGDNIGAKVQEIFVKLLAQDPSQPIIEAWRKANRSVTPRQPWAAFARQEYLTESLEDWFNIGPPAPPNIEIFYFNERNQNGKKINTNPDFTANFVMQDGTVITHRNNMAVFQKIGLIPGESGKILLESKVGNFNVGDSFHILFYMYRPTKLDMDLNHLFTFDSGLISNGTIELKKDLNHRKVGPKKTNKFDGIKIIFKTGTNKIEIPYTINTNLDEFWSDDSGPSDSTYGAIVMGLFPPGTALNQEKEEFILFANSATLFK